MQQELKNPLKQWQLLFTFVAYYTGIEEMGIACRVVIKILMVFMVVAFCGVDRAVAQSRMSLGVKAEGQASFFLNDNSPVMRTKTGFGGAAGLFVKLELLPCIALQPELLVIYKTDGGRHKLVRDNINYWAIEMPVYVMGQWNTGRNRDGRFYVGSGPYCNYGLIAKVAGTDLYSLHWEGTRLNRWDVGIGFIIGYEFPCGIQINVGHKFSMMNVHSGDRETIRSNSVSLGMGVRFKIFRGKTPSFLSALTGGLL